MLLHDIKPLLLIVCSCIAFLDTGTSGSNAYAQGFSDTPNSNFDVVEDPICFNVINSVPFNIYGDISTAKFPDPDGYLRSHTSNFKLSPTGSWDEEKKYFTDRALICAKGPFLPGRKLRLKIRTLIPVFECETRIDQGDITIETSQRADGTTQYSATCYP